MSKGRSDWEKKCDNSSLIQIHLHVFLLEKLWCLLHFHFLCVISHWRTLFYYGKKQQNMKRRFPIEQLTFCPTKFVTGCQSLQLRPQETCFIHTNKQFIRLQNFFLSWQETLQPRIEEVGPRRLHTSTHPLARMPSIWRKRLFNHK